ncbi:hypothetical protein, partial [Salmonella enterica]
MLDTLTASSGDAKEAHEHAFAAVGSSKGNPPAKRRIAPTASVRRIAINRLYGLLWPALRSLRESAAELLVERAHDGRNDGAR